ncbi:hypothetical protein GCM10011574_07840 [Microbispora bryophytorum]|uniref:Uncharacterized protein n=1 Tax=Microbispora bryophytorum TaxID=1460882 RepID=A0A8H9GWG8_9ACTN|nr:hypothetical protein GCM10011574_07840 [Microbispora bryophytorum]
MDGSYSSTYSRIRVSGWSEADGRTAEGEQSSGPGRAREAECDLAIREAGASWVQSSMGELTTGWFPDLAMWRAWRESGRMPPEAGEFAERDLRTD